MKATRLLLITVILFAQSITSLQAQNTEGKDFWLTFGRNRTTSSYFLDIQIRIVGGSKSSNGFITFTELGHSASVPFSVTAGEVFTHTLSLTEKDAVYNDYTSINKTNKSVHITSSENVMVYALNQVSVSTDATNILPIGALGTEYYQISYKSSSATYFDAYAVIATENNTQVYHNGISSGMLNAGQVLYYCTSIRDMTGDRITSDKPIAFFALNHDIQVPNGIIWSDHLFQQLAPVNTWGKNFFVPTSRFAKDRVRIMASQPGTKITQTGGILVSAEGSQMNLDNLNAGQWVELEITLANKGCYIIANNPIGVCAYLTGSNYNGSNPATSDPAQAWIPAIEQTVGQATIAPFIPNGQTAIVRHDAIIVTPTATKNNTTVSIGGAGFVPLSGGNWNDHTSGWSYYNVQLTNSVSSYTYANTDKLFVMCYGTGNNESYYYLACSAMRDLDAAFYANDIHFQEMKENPFCAGMVYFRAEINGLHPTHPQRIKWFVDGVEEPGTLNQETWNRTFTSGEYEIRMEVVYENNETATKTGILKIVSCNQSAEFYANNIHHSDLSNNPICNKIGKVDFRAEIEGLSQEPGSLKWYVDGVKEDAADDQLTWSKTFETGTYQIKMWVRYNNGETAEIISTLKVDIFWLKMQNIRH